MNIHARLEFQRLRQQAELSVDETAMLLSRSVRTVQRYEDITETGSDPIPLVIEKMRGAVSISERLNGDGAGLTKRKLRPRSVGSHGFTFIDLFAGIGGLRRPFEEIGGKCIFTAEWDQTYSANFHDDPLEHEFAEDVRPYAQEPWRVPEHDVLLAGFPCQPFSIAGVSKKNALGRPHGFLCDTQGTLFYDLAKIIEHHRPAAFLLENVKNLESHDGGRTFSTIMNVLENELGYRVQYRLVSSQPWVPQKRQRIFIVGFRNDTKFDFDKLEVPDGRQPVLGDILEQDPDPKYTLTQHLWGYLQNYKAKHAKAGNGFGFSVFGPGDVTRTLSARYYKDGSEVLIEQKGSRPRRLTPRECARLMGFDEPQGDSFRIPVSDTQAYRQFGNAVVVPVVQAVAKLMAPHIHLAVAARVIEESPPELMVASG
jgi:DNA (cytosine-5)-methyltransferase 1